MKSHNNYTSHALLPSQHIQLVLLFSVNLAFFQANASGNDTDILALLKFKQGIARDPNGVLKSWNHTLSLSFCKWVGITCSPRHQRVSSLDLEGHGLVGSVSPYIGNLSFLKILNLQNNSFHGRIPQEVGNLFRLQQLTLNDNVLEGDFPENILSCTQLKVIDLSRNVLSGKVPKKIGSLAMLEVLAMNRNNLTGEIPGSIDNLSSINFIDLGDNNLVGKIPDEVGLLSRLIALGLGGNRLSGSLPSSLFNMSSINIISIPQNQFSGALPLNVGFTLPNIQMFAIGENQFSGRIPESFGNASQLKQLDLSTNNFVGQVPASLGNLRSLELLNLAENSLGSNATNDLNFLISLTNCRNLSILDISMNHFGGVLPASLGNFSNQITRLYFGNNQITGTIPATLESLTSLVVLGLDSNLLMGSIPAYLGKFQNLQALALNGNNFSGQIPPTFGNLTQLLTVSMSQNKLEGPIPSSIGNCKNLYYFDVLQNNLTGAIPQEVVTLSSLTQMLRLSENSLTGNLPVEIGKLTSTNTIDVSGNTLTGEIPETIGDCSSLEFLYLQGNSFRGSIPSSLASIKGLQHLDLSRNKLSGKIPKDLQQLSFLQYLNLSFNNLEGEVPARGVFRNASAISLVGNSKLCGGPPEFNLPKCPKKVIKKGKSHAVRSGVLVACAALSFLLMLFFLLVYWIRRTKKKPSLESSLTDPLVKVSYRDLDQATSGFSSSHLVGLGSFGWVYKGTINQFERPVAIKVLNLEQKGASKSFMAECKVLRNIRHRNLVKILTYCSSIDYKRNEFKALVFEFMENGSLEKWLHPDDHFHGENNQSRTLNLVQRLNVAIDVASAMHYLHDFCERPIIHCDLKPSNVLLDVDMVAHVSDFGLARLFSTSKDQTQTSTIGLKGTVGYAPPEYGMGGPASKNGDVYSYGILLLEMFTGRRPTDEMFRDGLTLHDFVEEALRRKIVQMVDPALFPAGEFQGGLEYDDVNGTAALEEAEEAINKFDKQKQLKGNVWKCVVLVLEVGVNCSTESPKERMNMGEVNRRLHSIRSAFLGT